MNTSTLQIRAFPENVNRALKIKAIKQGITFRELIIKLLSEGAK